MQTKSPISKAFVISFLEHSCPTIIGSFSLRAKYNQCLQFYTPITPLMPVVMFLITYMWFHTSHTTLIQGHIPLYFLLLFRVVIIPMPMNMSKDTSRQLIL